jgi:adenosylmethionine-8-amino-7-oxononanoate aminotransferase
VLANNRHKSAYVFDKMQVLTHLPIKHLRHQGMIFAFDAVTEDAQFSKRCYQAAIEQGLLLRPIGNTVYFMPPYTITESEIDLMVNTTYAVLKAIL